MCIMPCWLLMGILILENIFCVYGCFTTCVLCVSHACSGTMEPRELDLQTAMRTKPRDLVKKKNSKRYPQGDICTCVPWGSKPYDPCKYLQAQISYSIYINIILWDISHFIRNLAVLTMAAHHMELVCSFHSIGSWEIEIYRSSKKLRFNVYLSSGKKSWAQKQNRQNRWKKTFFYFFKILMLAISIHSISLWNHFPSVFMVYMYILF